MTVRALVVGTALVGVGLTSGCTAITPGGPPTVEAVAGSAVSTGSTVGTRDDHRSGPPVAPGSGSAASSCRPANHRGVVTPDQPSAGHRHYRVVLTAPSGYVPCRLAGVPDQVVFHGGGDPLGVEVQPAPGRAPIVTFGPGRPVHFDIQVPDAPGGARAGSVTFTLRTPSGEIPGEQEASGPLEVDEGTQVGPIQPGG